MGMIIQPMNNGATIRDGKLKELVQTAIELGASDAALIPTSVISVADAFAAMCQGDPACPNSGLSPGCPPHVEGPAGFRKLQQQSQYSLVIKLDVRVAELFSDARREIMRRLHCIVSQVEDAAVSAGYKEAHAFAGGSCRDLFCHHFPDCPKLSREGACRYPQYARPSMSGFGINVASLMESAGWASAVASPEKANDAEAMTWVAGLVVVGGDR